MTRSDDGTNAPSSDVLHHGEIVADRYRIDAVIAQGGSGVVYRATQIELQRVVALKLLHRELVTTDGAVARFRQEAQQLARFVHPSVPTVFDFGQWRGQPYLALAHIDGPTLRARLSESTLALSQRLRLFLPICDVLAAVHRAGLIHRDLKPENTVVTGSADAPAVTLLDFGLAIAQSAFLTGDRLTTDGRVSGTPHFMSPEQCKGERLDSRSDLYALGVMLYEAICGHPPFNGETAMVILTQHVYDAPSPPSVHTDRAVPAALDHLVMWLLAKTADQRPASADVVGAALRRIVAELEERPAAQPQRVTELIQRDGHCRHCGAPGIVAEPCQQAECIQTGQYIVPDAYRGGPRFDDALGRMLQGYLVVDRIADGGFSTVYLALQPPLLMPVALKIMNPGEDEAATARHLEMFAREAVSLSQLRHPNIVRLLHYGQLDDARAFLVMEYVEEAKTLRELVSEGGLPWDAVWAICEQLLNALAYAHGHNLVHRDLKPDNVLVSSVPGYPYHVRVLDFGLAKLFSQTHRTQIAAGTPQYLAPEQVQRDGRIGPWTDLYALGVVLTELATGRPPFAGVELEQIFQAKLDPHVRWLDGYRELPPVVHAFVRQAVDPDPQARFPDAARCLAALRGCQQQVSRDPGGQLPATGRFTPPVPRAGRLRSPWLLGLTLLALLAGAAVVWMLSSGRRGPSQTHSDAKASDVQAPVHVGVAPVADAHHPSTLTRRRNARQPTSARNPPHSDVQQPAAPRLQTDISVPLPTLPSPQPKGPQTVPPLSSQQLIGRWRIVSYRATPALEPSPIGGTVQFEARGQWKIVAAARHGSQQLTHGTWRLLGATVLITQEDLPERPIRVHLSGDRLSIHRPTGNVHLEAVRLP